MQPIEVRLIPYKRLSGYENMAIDEYLIYLHERTGTPMLRVYGWSRPAISLGRYQRADCLDLEACRRDRIDVVRRITGGGAIFHDDELTYSFVCSDALVGIRDLPIRQSFEKLNSFIIDLYRGFGLRAHFAKDMDKRIGRGPDKSAAFCFSGRQEYDILVNARKMGGNAQRRTRGILFQHGSIPLTITIDSIRKYFRTPIESGEFTSLNHALGRKADYPELALRLADSFKAMMNAELSIDDMGPRDTDAICSIVEKKYIRDRWNLDAGTEDNEITRTKAAQ
ncbi:MAG: hypothetical protein A2W19_00160 [Spirochaetes bacterium RBG_16_49_21]|nr:MAG: hypothetical protein A2W19_00160 [Spirochaetes bacterium RBG_16_49_21]